MQNSDEQSLDEQVIANYKAVFWLPAAESIEVLAAYWQMLAENCTPDSPVHRMPPRNESTSTGHWG